MVMAVKDEATKNVTLENPDPEKVKARLLAKYPPTMLCSNRKHTPKWRARAPMYATFSCCEIL